MPSNDRHPDYATIQEHIRRAHMERSIVLAELIAGGIAALARALGAARQGLVRIVSRRTCVPDAARARKARPAGA